MLPPFDNRVSKTKLKSLLRVVVLTNDSTWKTIEGCFFRGHGDRKGWCNVDGNILNPCTSNCPPTKRIKVHWGIGHWFCVKCDCRTATIAFGVHRICWLSQISRLVSGFDEFRANSFLRRAKRSRWLSFADNQAEISTQYLRFENPCYYYVRS